MANPKGNPQNLKPFKPGVSPNPGGKPVGARNSLTAKFLHELAASFEKHGKAAIEDMAVNDPAKYVQVVAALVPKEQDVNLNHSGTVAHEHRAVSETVEWVAGMLRDGAALASEKPLPN